MRLETKHNHSMTIATIEINAIPAEHQLARKASNNSRPPKQEGKH
jgi:hypothetical protein